MCSIAASLSSTDSFENLRTRTPIFEIAWFARFVVLPLFLVNAPVKFDGKLAASAVEIDNVSFDHLLTVEVEPVDCVSPKSLPENSLGRRHFAAESLRERQLVCLNTLDARYFTTMWHEMVADTEEPNP